MKLIIEYDGQGETPAQKLIEFGKEKNDILIMNTDKGRVLWVHGSTYKSRVHLSLERMKNEIDFSNVDFITTCYPKYMKKFIKDENIDIKKSKILFPRYKKHTSTSFSWIDGDNLIVGLGKGFKHANRERRRAIKYYEDLYNVNIVNDEKGGN